MTEVIIDTVQGRMLRRFRERSREYEKAIRRVTTTSDPSDNDFVLSLLDLTAIPYLGKLRDLDTSLRPSSLTNFPLVAPAALRFVLCEYQDEVRSKIKDGESGNMTAFHQDPLDVTSKIMGISMNIAGSISFRADLRTDEERALDTMKWAFLLERLSTSVGVGSFDELSKLMDLPPVDNSEIILAAQLAAIRSFYEIAHRPEAEGLDVSIVAAMTTSAYSVAEDAP